MPAAAIVGLAGVAGSIYSANRQSQAARDAARAQTGAAADSNRLYWDMYQQTRTDNEPFRQNALTAQSEYMQLLGLGSPQAAQPTPATPPAGGGSGGGGGGSFGALPGGQSWMDDYRMGIPVGVQASQGQVQRVGPVGTGGTGGVQSVGDVRTGGPGQMQGLGALLQGGRVRDGNFFGGGASLPPPGSPPGGGLTAGTGGPGQLTPAPATPPGAPPADPLAGQNAAFDRFRNTPGYQFGLTEGRGQLESSAAARGGLYSGATLRALQRYGNDYADQQGFTPYMNRLASLAGMGQTVNQQNATMGFNTVSGMGQNLNNAANARASGLYNRADAASGLASNLTGIARMLGGMYQNRGGWG